MASNKQKSKNSRFALHGNIRHLHLCNSSFEDKAKNSGHAVVKKLTSKAHLKSGYKQRTNKKTNKNQTNNTTSKQITTTICVFNMASASDGVVKGKECVMRTAKPNGSAEMEISLEKDIAKNIHELNRANTAFRRVENDDVQASADGLGTLLRRVAEASTHEIEVLIDELHGLLKKLQSDGNRIQRDIERYAELSQGVMQLTAIISDNVKRIPGAPTISPYDAAQEAKAHG